MAKLSRRFGSAAMQGLASTFAFGCALQHRGALDAGNDANLDGSVGEIAVDARRDESRDVQVLPDILPVPDAADVIEPTDVPIHRDAGDACVSGPTVDLPDSTGTDTNCDGLDGDASRAVFVAAGGNDANDGSRAMPLATVQAAVARAVTLGRTQILVAAGSYAGAVTLASGLTLAGGYCAGFATRDIGACATTLATGAPIGVRADGVTNVSLEGITILSSAGTPASPSSAAFHAVRTSGLTLSRVTAMAGASVAGTAGAAGIPGTAGMNGTAATSRSNVGSGGMVACGGSNGGNGGAGGSQPDMDSSAGATGMDTTMGVAGGSAGPSVAHDLVGITGGAGRTGSAGLAGNGGGAFGSVDPSSGDYLPANGASGGAGLPGSGGGGGGGGGSSGSQNGGGGGGGGSGGCGGTSTGGAGGGGSFGITLVNCTDVVMSGCAFNAAAGAAGGAGGTSASGGSAGNGGAGALATGTPAQAGGAGGAGGPGGASGPGGGGGGGPSIGILVVGGSVPMVGFVATMAASGAGAAGGSGSGAASMGRAGLSVAQSWM